MHPVYAVDFIDAVGSDDLSGAWATSDGGTCYIRQIFTTVWFLWLRPYRDRRYATVFRGRLDGVTISGDWMDVPQADRTLTGSITLTVNNQKLKMTADAESEFADITWQKLYGATGVTCPVAKVTIKVRPGATCQGLVLAGASLTLQASLVPHTVTPPDFSWGTTGADGAQISADTFQIPNTPPPGTPFTVQVTATDANGCKYQAQNKFTTGTQEDVITSSEICGIMQELQHFIDSIYPSLPQIRIPIGPGDPPFFPTIGQLRQVQQFLTRVTQLTERMQNQDKGNIL
jgi:hypothetical protein